MDFGSVLYKAQKNELDVKQQGRNFYKTSIAPPKKEQREKKLSVNIQKFLARKEEEERQKKLELARKKQELLSLRNKDKKSLKRVQSMLKRTKSANKSVLEDAVDNVNTAVTAAGPLQPDEDDYGYVSKDASELYNNLIKKYSSMPPEEPKFSKSSAKSVRDISKTKDRVKAALQKEEEEKFLPRKRKRKSTNEAENGANSDDDSIDDHSSDTEKHTNKKVDEKKKSDTFRIPKKNVAAPPPIDFHSLLKLAEQKQHEPIVIEKNVEELPDRPMTQKEKQEYLWEKERKMRREMAAAGIVVKEKEKFPKKPDNLKDTGKFVTSASTPLKDDGPKKVAVTSNASSALPSGHKVKSASSYEGNKMKKCDIAEMKTTEQTKASVEGLGSHRADKSKASLLLKKSTNLPRDEVRRINSKSNQNEGLRERTQKLPIDRTSNVEKKIYKEGGEKLQEPKLLKKASVTKNESLVGHTSATSLQPVRQFPPADVYRNEPKKSLKLQSGKQLSFPDVVRVKPKPVIRRKVIESEDEYDSEMDDFIDDSEDHNDVSKYISEIFGYDRRKYARVDDDDECMESNFSQLQKEEYISTKHGILEDLADVRRTKLEKSRKKLR